MLFKNGRSVSAPPVRLLWIEAKNEDKEKMQAAFMVPKKNFKKAVHRNRIRRQMKEVYRLEKPMLHNHVKQAGRSFALHLTYTSKDMPVFKDLKEKIIIVLHRFMKAAGIYAKTDVHSVD
jgi:ribonuclease P protein component